MSTIKSSALKAARESGALIKRSLGRVASITYKGRNNIVTDVDTKSEKLIIERILTDFPDHAILSEERPPMKGASGYRWIIDPIDGTTNFAHGFPFFCVSIGVEKDGEMVLGVVYEPIRDELFFAEKGKGAFLNGKRIAVSTTRDLREGFLATGFSYGLKKRDWNVKYFKAFLQKTMAIRRAGSAALDLCYTACGRFDGYWEIDLKPWDSAAGLLIVREAGGAVTTFDGSHFTPYHHSILATNGSIHKEMVKVLTKF